MEICSVEGGCRMMILSDELDSDKSSSEEGLKDRL